MLEENIFWEAEHVRRMLCALAATEKLKGDMRLHAPLDY